MRIFKKATPSILQSEMNECGLACIAMIVGYNGKNIDLPSIRRLHDVSASGMSVRDILDTFTSIQMTANVFRVDIKDLYSFSNPVILHWELDHYVVLVNLNKKKAIINDPAVGLREISINELSNKFTGVLIEAHPTKHFKKESLQINFGIIDLFKVFTKKLGFITGILLISFVTEALSLSVPIGTQFTIDTLLNTSDKNSIYTFTIMVLAILVAKSLLSIFRTITIMHVRFFIGTRWSEMFFHKLTNLKLPFFQKRHIGDITSRFQSLGEVRDGIDADMISSFLEVILIFFSLIIILYYAPLLSIPPLTLSLLYILARVLVNDKYKRLKKEIIYHESIQQSHFIETIRSIPSIRMLNLIDIRKLEWMNFVRNSLNASNESFKLDLYLKTISLFTQSASAVLIISFAGIFVDYQFTAGLLVSMLLYSDIIVSRTIKLTDSVVDLTLLSVNANRLTDIVIYPEEESGGVAFNKNNTKKCIELKNLSFQYNNDDDLIFDKINLSICDGESIAIIGKSGCGKSTLFKLVSSLYTPTNGEILFYGINSKAINKKQLRDKIAYVMQDEKLLSGTISQNISSFATEIDFDKVYESSNLACIHDEIMNLPLGYETFIGDLGEGLSGGQIQRITIARALYRKPIILLLDETTSNLDMMNETKINKNISSLPITKIFIAHRPETIKSADRVFDLSENKWIGKGCEYGK